VEVFLELNCIKSSLNSRKSKKLKHPIFTKKFDNLQEVAVIPCEEKYLVLVFPTNIVKVLEVPSLNEIDQKLQQTLFEKPDPNAWPMGLDLKN